MKTAALFLVLTGICSLTCNVRGARILFYFGVSTYSHRIAVWPLVEALAAAGHSVTFMSPNPPKSSRHSNIANVTEFSPQSLQQYFLNVYGNGADLVGLRLQGDHQLMWDVVRESGTAVCEILMKDPEYLKLIKGPKFDLVVIDALYNDCAFGLVHYHRSKFIWYDTTHPFSWQLDALGFPVEASWIPDLAFGYEVPMSWLHRVHNTLSYVRRYFARAAMFKRIEAAVDEALGGWQDETLVGPLDIAAMEKNASLVLYNSHFSIENARSLPPLFVSVAGLHVRKDKLEGLPENIRTFIEDDSAQGFVYVSFGTAVQMHKMKEELRNILFNTIRKFDKVKFVWKWESDIVPQGLPSNVVTAKWMPQNDILAHPKIRGFVTHGGLLSIQEAITYIVPLIVFPFFAEQDFNAERAQRVGYGMSLDFRTLTRAAFEQALTAILHDPSYKEKMAEVSEAFEDRPSLPLDTALWHIDYVLRRKDTCFMMPLGVHQSWFVRRSLDVWGSIVGIVAALMGFAVGCCSGRRACRNRGKRTKEKAQ